ncbi:hypothetical protein Krac_9634 [Ktedonobacter racemifer DSM 44963]|uniref:Uncharacterized protein n=1 Tax=Ktedonobacter racemifer DSM 44963 TaxID=485913 RepID=D6TCV5_KTERA|nr:hypothetical protein Krac_9634 [Ktedonobacter racemifer DSM 44963]
MRRAEWECTSTDKPVMRESLLLYLYVSFVSHACPGWTRARD